MAVQKVRIKLEQGTISLPVECSSKSQINAVIQVSIALSLKRIADTLDGTAAGLCVTETLLGGKRPD